ITGSDDNHAPRLFDPGDYLTVPNAGSYVEIADAPNLRVNNQTVSMWVKPDGVSSQWQPLLTKSGPSGESNTRDYSLWIPPNTLNVHHSITLNGSNNPYTSTGSLIQGEWNHIAATYDGSTMKVYINGVLDSQASRSGTAYTGSEKLYIGGIPNGTLLNLGAFKGSIADVRLYNFAETQAQIQSSMRTLLTGTETGLVYNTHFGLDANGKVLNITGTPNPGALTGQAQVTTGIRLDEDSSYTFAESKFKVDFLYSDADGDPFAGIKLIALPTHGSLKLDGNAVTVNQAIAGTALAKLVYTPDANWNGVDGFDWQAYDGTSYSDTETLSLTVTPVSDAPVFTVGTPSATLVEAGGVANATVGTSTASVTLTKSDADSAASVRYDTTYLTTNGWTTTDSGATYSKSGIYGTATLTVATDVVSYQLSNNDGNTQALIKNQAVTDSFPLRVTDGVTTAQANAVFSITGSNDAPAITSSGAGTTATVSVAENTATAVAATASDIDGYYELFGSGQNVNLASGFQRDNQWKIVTLPTGSSVTDTVPYNAYVPRNVVGVFYGGNSGTAGSQGGITSGDNKYFWIAPASTTGAIRSGIYNWIAAQNFTVAEAGTYKFNFPASGDNELQFFINGSVDTSNPLKPTITGGTQIGPLAGNFTTVFPFTGQAQLNAGVNTAYMVLNDYGGETAALIGNSFFRAADFIPAFAITGGADQNLFNINTSTGVLSFKTAPDFENPADADKNNSYIVDVTVSDGDGATDVQTLTFNVTAVNESAPVITPGAASAVLIEAGGVANGTPGTASATLTLTLSDADAGDTARIDVNAMEEEEDWSTADGGATYTLKGT
ncbi:hypothetical protein FJZ55_06855, partial [Candidatus Woesearchaeota archaeon]|nr:hypothetical protein [Candidatus Woesearchaeota archaeon]